MSETTVEEAEVETASRKRQVAATLISVAVAVVLTGAASKAIDNLQDKIKSRIAPEPTTPPIED